MTKKPKAKKPGIVQKINKQQAEPEKGEIKIEGADDSYREIRIKNKLLLN
jgi:hypothetical protein